MESSEELKIKFIKNLLKNKRKKIELNLIKQTLPTLDQILENLEIYYKYNIFTENSQKKLIVLTEFCLDYHNTQNLLGIIYLNTTSTLSDSTNLSFNNLNFVWQISNNKIRSATGIIFVWGVTFFYNEAIPAQNGLVFDGTETGIGFMIRAAYSFNIKTYAIIGYRNIWSKNNIIESSNIIMSHNIYFFSSHCVFLEIVNPKDFKIVSLVPGTDNTCSSILRQKNNHILMVVGHELHGINNLIIKNSSIFSIKTFNSTESLSCLSAVSIGVFFVSLVNIVSPYN